MDESNRVEFSGLILGFCSAALSYMGYAQEGAEAQVNHDLAKQNIEIIKLLREKTKGNLSAEESELLEQAIPDLEARFAKAQSAK